MKQLPQLTSIILISLILFLCDSLGYFKILHTFQSFTVTPLQIASQEFLNDLGDLFESFSQTGALKDENRALKAKLIESQQIIQVSELLNKETTDSRNALTSLMSLGLPQNTLVAAKVLDLSYENREGYLWINKGENQGIKVNNTVLSNGIFIGTIVETQQNTAIIRSIFSAGYSFPVSILNRKTTGLAIVEQSGIIINEILLNEEISINDTVLTLLQQGSLSIPFGSISSLNNNNDKLTRSATLEPFITPDSLNYVIVISQ